MWFHVHDLNEDVIFFYRFYLFSYSLGMWFNVHEMNKDVMFLYKFSLFSIKGLVFYRRIFLGNSADLRLVIDEACCLDNGSTSQS